MHDNLIIERYTWTDSFTFEQFLTHTWTISNIAYGAIVIAIIIFFAQLGNWLFMQRQKEIYMELDTE